MKLYMAYQNQSNRMKKVRSVQKNRSYCIEHNILRNYGTSTPYTGTGLDEGTNQILKINEKSKFRKRIELTRKPE